MFGIQQKLNLDDLFIEPKTGLLGKEYFLWILSQETYRVERTNQPLSMLLLEISDIKDMIQTRNISLNGFVDAIVRIFNEDFRRTDIKGWYDNGIIAILMPNTPESGASIAYKKLKEELAESLSQKDFKPCNYFEKVCSIHTYPDSILNGDKLLDKGSGSKVPIKNPYILCQKLFRYQNKSKFQYLLKRIIDLLGSIIGLLCLLPVISIIGLLIKLTSPGPIFFKQTRLGDHGCPFIFYKFRTMYHDVDDKSHREYVSDLIKGNHEKINRGSNQEPLLKMNNDPRVTPFGNLLRKSSLDELPQFFNVLKGEMSLVGPRPPIPYEVEKYKIWHLKRILEVKPGITGLWQVNGRSRTTFNDMVRMDLKYAKNWNIGMDIKILFKTIKVVLSAKGAY